MQPLTRNGYEIDASGPVLVTSHSIDVVCAGMPNRRYSLNPSLFWYGMEWGWMIAIREGLIITGSPSPIAIMTTTSLPTLLPSKAHAGPIVSQPVAHPVTDTAPAIESPPPPWRRPTKTSSLELRHR